MITGHHHISLYTKNAKRNKNFYTHVLGLRLVEKSVNQDDPSMYHLFFGDEVGSPGTIVSFFEFPNIGQAHHGTQSISQLGLLVKDEGSLRYFAQRLAEHGIPSSLTHYAGQPALQFRDVDDVRVCLIANNHAVTPKQWCNNTYTEIPSDYQILGLGPIELRVTDAQSMRTFLSNVLGYHHRSLGTYNAMTLDDNGLYSDFIIVEDNDVRARPGQGYVHHIAVNTPTDQDLEAVRAALDARHYKHTGVIDRYFFKSLYYRHNGIMFEFATATPGFTVDTPVEDLGKTLNVPDFLHAQKDEIEAQLEEL